MVQIVAKEMKIDGHNRTVYMVGDDLYTSRELANKTLKENITVFSRSEYDNVLKKAVDLDNIVDFFNNKDFSSISANIAKAVFYDNFYYVENEPLNIYDFKEDLELMVLNHLVLNNSFVDGNEELAESIKSYLFGNCFLETHGSFLVSVYALFDLVCFLEKAKFSLKETGK